MHLKGEENSPNGITANQFQTLCFQQLKLCVGLIKSKLRHTSLIYSIYIYTL